MSGRRACSTGRKALTSPPEGFTVPSAATTRSAPKAEISPNPSPVAIIDRGDQLQQAGAVDVHAPQADGEGDDGRAQEGGGDDRAHLHGAEPPVQEVARQHDGHQPVDEGPQPARAQQPTGIGGRDRGHRGRACHPP